MNRAAALYNERMHGQAGGPRSGRYPLAGAQEMLIFVFDKLGDWQERGAQRRRLMALDERMLHDIGMCRTTAIDEAAKPFWKS